MPPSDRASSGSPPSSPCLPPRTLDDPGTPPRQNSKDDLPTTPPRPIEEPAPKGTSILDPVDEQNLEISSEHFIKHQNLSTPFGPALQKPRKINPKRDDHKAAIRVELGAMFVLPNDKWVKTLYVDLVEDSEIKVFLSRTTLYSKRAGRWTGLPATHDDLDESTLYEPFVKIINAILNRFVLRVKNPKKREILRKAIDTHVKNIPHEEKYATTRFSRPDVSVKAEGESFQEPKAKPGQDTQEVGFSNMSSFMEMKVDRRNKSPREQGLQVGVYVRQIFIQQPNRRFVRVLLLTEKNVRLFHFDRSGVMCSPYIDIHENPSTFIRLVAGLNSLDGSVLGLDTSIKWMIEGGRKIGGTLTWRADDSETKIEYQLCDVNPVVECHDIRGRGTRCWHVSDPDTGSQYWVKDCWRAEDRVSEHIYLQEARNSPGVAQMVAFEANREETKNFRGADGISHNDFHNRVAVRIVTDCYGHLKLFGKDILHRDITLDNILLGRKGTELEPKPGYWGVLSDLHMAIKVERDTKKVSIEWRTGPRTYLSIEVLRNCNRFRTPNEIAPAQDHLDDLESFLYVYAHIISQYDEYGEELAYTDNDILQWESNDADTASQLKIAFLARTSVPPRIKERWPIACINVLLGFREFIFQQVRQKTEVHDNVPLQERADEINKIVAKISTHYSTVLCLFNSGIAELENAATRLQIRPLDPKSPTPAAGKRRTLLPPGDESDRNLLKRGPDDLLSEDSEDSEAEDSADSPHDDRTAGKRRRTQL